MGKGIATSLPFNADKGISTGFSSLPLRTKPGIWVVGFAAPNPGAFHSRLGKRWCPY
jgi:hypothetical protein